MSRVHIGTIHWDHKKWNDSYYPDDIPDEWKLAFYANDFSAIVLPENLWRTAEIEALAEYLEDLDEQFAVYCLLETGCLDEQEIAAVKSLLDPYFRGFIVKQSQLSTGKDNYLDDCIYPLADGVGNSNSGTRYWAELPISTQQPLEVLFVSREADLKKLRQYFEQVRQQLEHGKEVLIAVTPADSEPAPDIEFLQQLRTLLELMAIA